MFNLDFPFYLPPVNINNKSNRSVEIEYKPYIVYKILDY